MVAKKIKTYIHINTVKSNKTKQNIVPRVPIYGRLQSLPSTQRVNNMDGCVWPRFDPSAAGERVCASCLRHAADDSRRRWNMTDVGYTLQSTQSAASRHRNSQLPRRANLLTLTSRHCTSCVIVNTQRAARSFSSRSRIPCHRAAKWWRIKITITATRLVCKQIRALWCDQWGKWL